MIGKPTVSVDELTEDELSLRWREETRRYVSAVNEFVRRGLTEGWDNVDAGDEPKDTTAPMAKAVLNAIRNSNESHNVKGLHERFPRSHSPFVEMLKESGQSLPVAMLLDDGRILMRVGSPYETGRVVLIDGDKVESLPPSIISVGRSPDRACFAIARDEGVTIHHGWDGPIRAVLKWPTGLEGIPTGFKVEPILRTPAITRIIPFNSGDKLLLVSSDGIFVLGEAGTIRLLPTHDQMKEYFEWLRKDYPADPLKYELSMEHAAISPNGKLIAAGHQSSVHYVFDADTYDIVAEVGPLSEYPHHAAFNADGSVIALNACHFYNGATIGLPVKLLPGIKTAPYEVDGGLIRLEEESRVYSAVARNDEFIIGDAGGYLRAFDGQGRFRWRHFIGSSICDIDISRDGKRMIATTAAGFLSVLDLDTGEADPFVIGTSTHRERRRWLFWKTESKPMIW